MGETPANMVPVNVEREIDELIGDAEAHLDSLKNELKNLKEELNFMEVEHFLEYGPGCEYEE